MAVSREARFVFGEVAEQYDAYRPSYPEVMFDTVVSYGGLARGDAALEIGAGTGKATRHFLARGIGVHAIEPDAAMAAVLRQTGVPVDATTFEDWTVQRGAFRLVYAAQAWHWVTGVDRYQRVGDALAPDGAVAFFWNKARELDGELGSDIDAAYDGLAPQLRDWSPSNWTLDTTLDELRADFREAEKRVITWSTTYPALDYCRMNETTSSHRLLPPEQLADLLAAVAEVIDAHGGTVPVTYDTELYLGRHPRRL
jgi:SAM-dependent methyltransferase